MAPDTTPSKYARQEPIVILVGPQAQRYFVHKELAMAKSPYFRTRLKDCWNLTVKEIQLPDLTTSGFDVVLDWIYGGKLSENATDGASYTFPAYKAADMLMMPQLSNELIRYEANRLHVMNKAHSLVSLETLYGHDLQHSKLYDFILRDAVRFMTFKSRDEYEQEIDLVKDNPQILADVLRVTKLWSIKPWMNFRQGDLSEFFVPEMEDTTEPAKTDDRVPSNTGK